jgi:protein-tyrosine phosphatase
MRNREAEAPGELANLRDLGGLTGSDGRVLPPGRLFRSEAPATDASPRAICGLGLRLVVDLRSAAERTALPACLADVCYVPASLPVVSWLDSDIRPADAPVFLAERYLTLAEAGTRGANPMGAALSALLRPTPEPRIVWCAGGKDRTGIVVAVLLDLLGVDRDDIARDYAHSAAAAMERLARARTMKRARNGERLDREQRRNELRAALSAAPAVPGTILNPAPREAIVRFLECLDERYGGAHGFAAAAGVAASTVAEFRHSFPCRKESDLP